MGLSNYTCPECGKRTKTPLVKTMTGRTVCTGCRDGLLASAAGVIVAGDASPIGSAVATRGWFRRLRKRRAD